MYSTGFEIFAAKVIHTRMELNLHSYMVAVVVVVAAIVVVIVVIVYASTMYPHPFNGGNP